MLKSLRNNKGSVIVLSALIISAMLGFGAIVVDLGNLFLNKTWLMNMADAAALAGVMDLPGNPQLAVNDADSYAAQNGKAGDTVQAAVSNSNTVLTVTASRSVPLFFARIFNLTSSTVTAQVAAAIRPMSQVSGAVPFGVVKQNFIYGDTYQLKAGAGGGYGGNYGALALGGNGANVYRDNIEKGYSGTLTVGEWVSTQPGNMSGPTSQGVAYRIGLDPSATFSTVSRGSPRIVTVPIIDSIDGNGRCQVQIVGFAAFFLEGVGGQGNDNYVYGEFMQLVKTGQSSSAATDYGLYGSALIQ
jgi:Flp pilus assembly protein TadG